MKRLSFCFLTLCIASVVAGYTRYESVATGWFQSESAAYREGRAALDRSDWETAVRAFSRASSEDDPADGALYWLAYAQNRGGDGADALQTLDRLTENYPESAWLDDARALRQEMGGSRAARTSIADEDEELKLMALNGLMHADEAQAVPLLEEFLNGEQSERLRSRALFVLAQSDSPRAQQILGRAARDGSDEDLQRDAIRYLGVHDGPENLTLLNELYSELTSASAKKAVLHAFMVSDQRGRLLELARTETDEDLRGQAVHWLGTMDAEDELWQLFQAETSLDVKKKILHALFIGDSAGRLLEVARDTSQPEELRSGAIHWLGVGDHQDELWSLYQEETSIEVKKGILHGFFVSDNVDRLIGVAQNGSEEMELRSAAIHNLGISDDEKTRGTLLAIYRSESDVSLREQALHSLFLQEAVSELIELARQENDVSLKKKIVHWLSIMDDEEAKQFMLEILRR